MVEDPPASAATLDGEVVQQLRYKDQASLLDAIDQLALQGLRKYVSLPRIIVCGDQSSGKSSVLEAISHVRFPTKDTVCTTFATELVIRRTPTGEPPVSIIPALSRDAESKSQLEAFNGRYNGPEDLPDLIEAAKRAMEASGNTSTGSFFEDKLRIQICKPEWPPLTIVDLPGLIHSANDGQTKRDVDLVWRLVKGEMSDPRSIILAIVSAQYDAANQAILSLAKEVDPPGVRTLGVITKPDKLPPVGSEGLNNFIRLARNEPGNYRFQLGWHALKNRDYVEKDSSTDERDAAEKAFFEQEPWRTCVLPSSLGVDALRVRLSKVLHEQIVSSLPDVIEEIRKGIKESESRLERLPPNRSSKHERQGYLMKIAWDFQTLVKSAVDGVWDSSLDFFGDPFSTNGYERRLRAVTQNLNDEFAEKMSLQGHRWEFLDNESPSPKISTDPSVAKQTSNEKNSSDSFASLDSKDWPIERPVRITKGFFLKKIEELSRATRGRELPGVFNHLTIGELFREQSGKWNELASYHVDNVCGAVKFFVEQAFESLTDRRTFNALMCEFVDPEMEKRHQQAMKKLDEILTPYVRRHPISYNSTLVRGIKVAKVLQHREKIRAELQSTNPGKLTSELTDGTLEKKLVEALYPGATASTDKFACSDILDHMNAYYEVSMNTFIDNVASLVIERCLIDNLANMIPSDFLQNMDDETLDRITGEADDVQMERQMLGAKLDCLKDGLKICLKHAVHVSRDVLAGRRASSTFKTKLPSHTASGTVQPIFGTFGSTTSSTPLHTAPNDKTQSSFFSPGWTTPASSSESRRSKSPFEGFFQPLPKFGDTKGSSDSQNASTNNNSSRSSKLTPSSEEQKTGWLFGSLASQA